MKICVEQGQTVVYAEGSITSDNAPEFERELLQAAQEASGDLVMDAERLSGISSAGLRALLVLTKNAGRKVTVRNVSPEVYETFEITGFSELLDVRKRMRVLSVEGCEKIGQGALGSVYRISPDTIVKVFKSADSLPMIRTELARSRQAFVCGLPTAIPFDIVRVDDRYGAVYELLDAETLNDFLIRHPERTDEMIGKYVRLMRQVHAAESRPGELPSARDVFLGYTEDLKEILPAGTAARLRELLREMPEDLHMIHGDLQMKNVMVSGDSLLLIDMETLSTGNPVFDLQALYVCYRSFVEDDPEDSMRFMGISEEQCRQIWTRVLAEYFRELPPERIPEMEDRIRILACLRFLDRIITHGMTEPELREIRVRHTLEALDALLKRTDTLVLPALPPA